MPTVGSVRAGFTFLRAHRGLESNLTFDLTLALAGHRVASRKTVAALELTFESIFEIRAGYVAPFTKPSVLTTRRTAAIVNIAVRIIFAHCARVFTTFTVSSIRTKFHAKRRQISVGAPFDTFTRFPETVSIPAAAVAALSRTVVAPPSKFAFELTVRILISGPAAGTLACNQITWCLRVHTVLATFLGAVVAVFTIIAYDVTVVAFEAWRKAPLPTHACHGVTHLFQNR